jgi:hypothetical protein
LFDREQQQHHTGGDGRVPMTNARRAAEALFTEKRLITEQHGAEGPLPANQLARKPRVLRSSVPPAVRHEEIGPPASHAMEVPRAIPTSQVARIRTWVKYGMTVPQVAQLYGVAVGEIEPILRKG